LLVAILVTLSVAACGRGEREAPDPLVGAWRGDVQFSSGGLATTKDLEFMYVFNAGGTMTESSNYDGSPPVPPAYGSWRRLTPRRYEATYLYYWTRPPASFDEIAKGNGWTPGGHGVLSQEIALSTDGDSFESTIRLQLLDKSGSPVEPMSVATAKASRIGIR
jgi:hypothetical protein